MSGAIPPLPHYALMAWCSVKAQGQLYRYWAVKMRIWRTFKHTVMNLRVPQGNLTARGILYTTKKDLHANMNMVHAPPNKCFRAEKNFHSVTRSRLGRGGGLI
jgi:hypothetical protein